MENTFVKYADLLTITDYNKEMNKEKFEFLPVDDELVIGKYQEKCNMLNYGDKIPVRKTVYNKLKSIGQKLKSINCNYRLFVVYGFRALEIQTQYFNEIIETIKGSFNDEIEMYEYVHERVAVPNVAGHPTGGAVDVTIFNNDTNEFLDFGSQVLDWNDERRYYISKGISDDARVNRKLLRELMLVEEFAPFDGEWWHFSYGDKEWAFYYKYKQALYNQASASEAYSKVFAENNLMIKI